MKIRSFTALLLFALAAFPAFSQGTSEYFNTANKFFSTYVEDGLVEYKTLHNAPGMLNNLVKQTAAFPYNSADESTRKAFLINAYNILMIHSVVEHYPISSPTDVDGIFDKKTHTVGGMTLTLSDIENKRLRKDFPDARLHFVLVCGAISCPPLAEFAYQPSKLDEQLNQRTKKALNDPSFIKVNPIARKALISEIFKWYKSDFMNEADDYLSYINKYRDNKIPASFEVGFYTYNWSLNEKK